MSEEKDKKDFSKTLNLPRTGFPMKANLAAREPETLSYWEDGNVYGRRLEKNRDNEPFVLHDGPPYANGHLHIGHALNKILKDIIVKHRLLQGRYAPYVPGWDCHGLPIELQVDKKLGSKKKDLSLVERRKQCRAYAERFVDIQRDEFRRMGGFGDWANPYLTMAYSYEATIVREFAEFVKKGYVYEGRKPVHWCASCVTALAEAEVEYADKRSPAVYVAFPLEAGEAEKIDSALEGKSVSVVIWTTTPWTLPANLALAVHPDIDYVAARREENFYLMARARFDAVGSELGFEDRLPTTVSGNALLGLTARHPFIDRVSRIVPADFVSTEDGSGIVHIAPGHGDEDYRVGLENGLDVYAPVDNYGRFTNEVPDFEGEPVFRANDKIIQTLADKGRLLRRDEIEHSYPHCWRCRKPVIFRATEQWFISMAHQNLRDRALKEIDRVQWHPETGRNRIAGMVGNRPDWCVSRQRAWGVPITLMKCTKCRTTTTDESALESFVGHVEKAGADVWFEKSATELLPAGYSCANCGATDFEREKDILDVWFDSGVSHAAVLERRNELNWPADLYLEGSDQHRGWFQSSLLASVGTRNSAPYRQVLTHGFIVDGQGRKMSKSLGNVVSPQEIIRKNGAELLRLWVSAADYSEDVRISDEILKRLVEAYRKIRNTCRYLLGNLFDFDPSTQINVSALPELDRFALSRLQHLIERISKSYETFQFHEVYHGLYHFCIVEMSSFYFDILKDRLYTFRADSPERRGAQWVLFRILKALTGMMAPILSFTAEEVHRHTPGATGSVFEERFPAADASLRDQALEERWLQLTAIRDDVNKAIEIERAARVLGNSLEASVHLFARGETATLLETYRDELPMILIVSEARLEPFGTAPEGAFLGEQEDLRIRVVRSDGIKCERCWNRRFDVDETAPDGPVCGRCREVLS